MAYADGSYYGNTWGGRLIPDHLLNRYLESASDEIDAYTFCRLVGRKPDKEWMEEKLQRATCEIAELLYQVDALSAQAFETVQAQAVTDGSEGSGRVIKSISDGTESITYASAGELAGSMKSMSAAMGAAGSIQEKEKQVAMILYKRLDGVTAGGVGVLYKGV